MHMLRSIMPSDSSVRRVLEVGLDVDVHNARGLLVLLLRSL